MFNMRQPRAMLDTHFTVYLVPLLLLHEDDQTHSRYKGVAAVRECMLIELYTAAVVSACSACSCMC